MQKIKLDLDSLAVDSFDTAEANADARGTVAAHSYVAIYLGAKAGAALASWVAGDC